MKLEVNRAAFAEALGLVGSVVPARTPKPILRCVRLSALGEEVRLWATDLEVGINCLLSQVSVNKAGDIVIPADRLAAIVRESADEVLLLEAAGAKCEIKGADSHFTILGQQAEQYPEVPRFDGKADVEVQLGTLQRAIEQCLFATAKESTRYALNGVLWEFKGKKLSLVATDGRRLARVRVSMSSAASEAVAGAKLIIPAKTMALLDKVGGSDDDAVLLKYTDNRVLISCGSVNISSGLVEGNFPKYEDIIPADYDKKVQLPVGATLSAVRRAAILTSEESRGIKISLTKGSLTFSGRAPEAGDAEVEMPVDYAGDEIEIGFNPQFVIDVLRVMQPAQFELELGGADRPALIKQDGDFIYVLMPISLG